MCMPSSPTPNILVFPRTLLDAAMTANERTPLLPGPAQNKPDKTTVRVERPPIPLPDLS